MDSCQITTLVSAIANCMAKDLTDEELAVAATILTQLGDTLSTISAINNCKSQKSIDSKGNSVYNYNIN